MTTAVYRRARSRRLAVALVGALAAGTVLVASGPAGAVHDDNLFELGPTPAPPTNIVGDGVVANGPDWADIFNASGGVIDGALATFGGVAASFEADENSAKGATDSTTFGGAGGSNKNNDPLDPADCVAQGLPANCDTWHWDGGNNPAKDDLTNVYAYATFDANDDLIIYSGFERIAPEGDSHVDIEFFQDPVALDEDVPCKDSPQDATPCEFTGVRTEGDLIVSMDFVTGGGIGEVSIRAWDSSLNEYVQVGVSAGQGCNGADTICAFNNGIAIDGGPWVNFERGGDEILELPQNAFTEFGVNVTELLGGTPCISTFMGKTRSSQSFTAELKDFSGPAGFNICGASIAIAPDDVNEVGQDHTFTVTVLQQLGATTSPAEGVIVDVDLTDANGAINDISANTCASPPGTDASGQCSVTFTSDSPGTVTGHASADVDVFGTSFHVETDGTGENSGDAVKRFVDANISITPNDVNEVGQTHIFTVDVQQNVGLGDGFVDVPDGTIVTVTLTPDGVADDVVDTCATAGTVAGECTVTFTSETPTVITGHASVSLTIDGLTVVRETDGTGDNSGDATKRFVDAFITIGPNDINSVGETHIFTVTVQQDDGGGGGFVDPPDNTVVTVTLTGDADGVVDTCADPGLSGGECTVTFTSDTAGTVTAHASVTLTIATLSVTRQTDGTGDNSGDAVKEFVAGSIRWSKVDNATPGVLQGGATFEVCRTHDFNTDTLLFEDIDPDVCVTVVDDVDGVAGPGLDQDGDPGQFLLSGLRLGRYTVDETVAPPGFEPDPAVRTVEITLDDPDFEIAVAFVNQRPILKLTEFGYTNEPTGTPTAGVVSGVSVFTAVLENFGGASAALSGSLVLTGQSPGCASTTPISDASFIPGETITVTATCTYTNAADGTVVTATLDADYTLNGQTREASGSPAQITFTIQAD